MSNIQHSLSSNGANIWLNLSFTLNLCNSLKFRGGWKVERKGKNGSLDTSTSGSALNFSFHLNETIYPYHWHQLYRFYQWKVFRLFHWIISASANVTTNRMSVMVVGRWKCEAVRKVNGIKKLKLNPSGSSGSLPRWLLVTIQQKGEILTSLEPAPGAPASPSLLAFNIGFDIKGCGKLSAGLRGVLWLCARAWPVM